MTFIVYSQITEEKLAYSLGMPEYSYYFVLKGFLPVLRELGEVIVVEHPEQEVDVIYDACQKRGENCVFISFSPPNKTATGLRCPTVCVLAWEFDRIPDEVWDGDPKNDWRYVFSNHGQAITLSQYSANSVRRAMGQDFPVVAIPVPVWDFFASYRNRNKTNWPPEKMEIALKGNIIDSRNYHITPESFELIEPSKSFQLRNWAGGKLFFGFTETDEFSAHLGGFYRPEPWGTWSRIDQPWVMFPYLLSGDVHVKIRARGYAHNADKEMFASFGDEKSFIRFQKDFSEITVRFNLRKPENILKFSGLDVSPAPNASDPRSMGIGLCSIEMWGDPHDEVENNMSLSKDSLLKVNIEGIVYTCVLNPKDERKNWTDIVKAFGMAFRDVEDATLLLKMTHHSLASFLGELHILLQQMWPFKCRIIALHGYLHSVDYEKLIAATHFYVNASKCEGLCLPLMEYMTCAKPAIAPCNTSLADFVEASNTLIVESDIEPSIWPHDPRHIFRALKYRINWESLVDAFQKSYGIAKNQPDIYRKMAKSASLTMEAYSANRFVKAKLQDFLNKAMKL